MVSQCRPHVFQQHSPVACVEQRLDTSLSRVRFDQFRELLIDRFQLGVQAVIRVGQCSRSVGSKEMHVVVTGRDASDALIEIADIVTDMQAVRHPYDDGVKAQKGIEF